VAQGIGLEFKAQCHKKKKRTDCFEKMRIAFPFQAVKFHDFSGAYEHLGAHYSLSKY
jgi:hypothetical protein